MEKYGIGIINPQNVRVEPIKDEFVEFENPVTLQFTDLSGHSSTYEITSYNLAQRAYLDDAEQVIGIACERPKKYPCPLIPMKTLFNGDTISYNGVSWKLLEEE